MKRFMLSLLLAVALTSTLISVPTKVKAEYSDDYLVCAATGPGGAHCGASPEAGSRYCEFHREWGQPGHGWILIFGVWIWI